MKKFCILLAVILCLCSSAVFATDLLDLAPLDTYPQDYENDIDDLDNFDISVAPTGENIIQAGDDVNVSGSANDLIILAGNNVNSNANGLYSFIAGNTINISNATDKDIFVAGKDVSINGSVGRDAYLVGSNVSVNSKIGRNIYVFASSFTIGDSAIIDGDINISAANISIADGAIINGTVTYSSSAVANIPSSIKTNVIKDLSDGTEHVKHTPSFVSTIKNIVFWTIANFILFALTLLIAPGLFKKVSDVNRVNSVGTYFKSLGFGLLLLIAVPFIAILLMLTLIGMPFSFISLFLYITSLIYSTTFVGYLVGDTIFKDNMNNYLKGLLGILIVEILKVIPFIGGLVSFATILIALGLLIVAIFRKNVEPKEVKIEE